MAYGTLQRLLDRYGLGRYFTEDAGKNFTQLSAARRERVEALIGYYLDTGQLDLIPVLLQQALLLVTEERVPFITDCSWSVNDVDGSTHTVRLSFKEPFCCGTPLQNWGERGGTPHCVHYQAVLVAADKIELAPWY